MGARAMGVAEDHVAGVDAERIDCRGHPLEAGAP
jgi:hypothetical protein